MKISAATIERIRPIVDQIDTELEKEQDDRTDFQVYSDNVTALKNALAHYKSVYKRDIWNGKFWMIKSTDKKTREEYLDFRFGAKPVTKFSVAIKTSANTPDSTPDFEIRHNDPIPADGVMREMSDAQISQFILMEQPDSAVFDRSFLSNETNRWLDDPKVADPSALINLLERRGYQATSVLGTRMRIFR
jgi:hypothetical protein